MHFNGLLATFLLGIATNHLRPVNGHSNHDDSTDAFILGNDGPADPATIGYTINHFGLLVNNITASMHFYGEVLGMRHVFTYHASSAYAIAYLGHSQGGKNGTGYQSGAELYAQKTNTAGLLELMYLKDVNDAFPRFTPSTEVVNTFSHVGLVVPDVKATEARMIERGVRILKKSGADIVAGSDMTLAFGILDGSVDIAATKAGIEAIGFKDFLIIADPDGNMIEIQAQR